uniref:Peptidase S1 domain-containing protein n=1 Tax=Anopheles dirus TaxID=7168 RepID=A0A182MYH2_9DIPT
MCSDAGKRMVRGGSCTSDDGVKVEIVFGLVPYDSDTNVQIQRIIVHPKFNSSSNENDIALIELLNSPKATFDRSIPICLPVTPEQRNNNYDSLYMSTSIQVKFFSPINASYLNNRDCRRKYAQDGLNVSLERKQFCAERTDPSEGNGLDCYRLPAGTPLLQVKRYGNTSKYMLRGFNLFRQMCPPTKPSVFIDINEYIDWILYHMRYKDFTKVVEVKKITVHPDFTHFPRRHDVALIRFRNPLDLTNWESTIRPICMPWTESIRTHVPLSLALSTSDFIVSGSRQLRQLNSNSCQQRFLEHGYFINHQSISLCAVHSDEERQRPVSVVPGAPIQALQKIKGQNRYFLRGLQHYYQYNATSIRDGNVYIPYLFTDIYPELNWILESIRFAPRNNLLYRTVHHSASELGIDVSILESDQVNLMPIQHTANGRLFNYGACGAETPVNISNQATNSIFPWYGTINSRRCAVTLISEWYLVSLAACLYNYTGKIKFGNDGKEQLLTIEKVLIHPEFDYRLNRFTGIALALLSNPVIFNGINPRPICLPIADEVRSPGYKRSNLITVGYLRNHGGLLAAIVGDRYTDVNNCQNPIGSVRERNALSSTMCIYTPPLNIGERYDQYKGSPMFNVAIINGMKRHFLRGFAVYAISNDNHDSDIPVNYVDIENYLDWITNH